MSRAVSRRLIVPGVATASMLAPAARAVPLTRSRSSNVGGCWTPDDVKNRDPRRFVPVLLLLLHQTTRSLVGMV
jgi:hypothetical protein